MNANAAKVVTLLTLLTTVAAHSCSRPREKQAKDESVSPARFETRHVGEQALAAIRLTAQARERLGITTVEARMSPAIRYHTVAGEIVVPPGQLLAVAAPLAGTVSFTSGYPSVGSRIDPVKPLLEIKPLLSVPRDLRTNAEADVQDARTRLETAILRAERAENMLRDKVGSQRAKEETAEAVKLAQSALAAALARLEQVETSPMEGDVSVPITAPREGILRQIYVAPAQLVAAGTPLFEIVRLDPLWVRTPVFSGDMDLLQPGTSVYVRAINASPGTEARLASPVEAPPTADALTATTDLYFALPNASLTLHPGERVSVSIPMRSRQECLQVPYSAILFDVQGGTWVYEEIEPFVYSRVRVLVDYIADKNACLVEGPNLGAAIVATGGPELFGEEFGVGH